MDDQSQTRILLLMRLIIQYIKIYKCILYNYTEMYNVEINSVEIYNVEMYVEIYNI